MRFPHNLSTVSTPITIRSNTMEKVIKQFLREYSWNEDERGNPIGVLLAEVKDNKLAFGWSVMSPLDNWNKQLGQKIAQNRLNNFDPSVEQAVIVPTIMVETMTYFIQRAEKYFQTTTNVRVIDGFELATRGREK